MVPENDTRPADVVENVEFNFELSTSPVSGSKPTSPSGVISPSRAVPAFSSATVGAERFAMDGTE
jgi:hypothetical protein